MFGVNTETLLVLKRLSALLFIKRVALPLRKFNPEKPWVKSWFRNQSFAESLQARACKSVNKEHNYNSLWKLLIF